MSSMKLVYGGTMSGQGNLCVFIADDAPGQTRKRKVMLIKPDNQFEIVDTECAATSAARFRFSNIIDGLNMTDIQKIFFKLI